MTKERPMESPNLRRGAEISSKASCKVKFPLRSTMIGHAYSIYTQACGGRAVFLEHRGGTLGIIKVTSLTCHQP